MHIYAIKYTTPWMRGFRIHFSKATLAQHAIAELRKLEAGVRVMHVRRKVDGEVRFTQ